MSTQSRNVPILFKSKAHCCGCSACFSICPRDAIIMREDEEGFVYPVINEKLCVRCGQCIKGCPIKITNC